MQGRFKRDGSGSAQGRQTGGVAEPELRAGTGPTTGNSAPPHASGSSPAGDAERSAGGAAAGGATTPALAAARKGPGPRIALRNWRISTRLVSLLALPVVAATSLGALRINSSMDEIEQLDSMKLLTEMTKEATELANALQEERDETAGPLSTGSPKESPEILGLYDKTETAQKQFLSATQGFEENRDDKALDTVRSNLTRIAGQLNKIKNIRNDAYQDDTSSSQTVSAYNRLIEQLLDLSRDMALATSSPAIIERTRILSSFSAAKEYASIQRAIISAALPDSNKERGELSETDRAYGQAALEGEDLALGNVKREYAATGEDAVELLAPIDNKPIVKETNQYAGRVLAPGNGLKNEEFRSYKDWSDDASTKIVAMGLIERQLLDDMEQTARELRQDSEQEAILNGALILLVLGISLVGAFVVARSMIRSLRRLQDTATKVAQDRLPELVKQLSESDPQDIDTSVESVGVHSRDEIGQVAAAFDDVHREAVRLAAEQALLRGNVNAMFTNLSRRSQGLIQRQLSLISELESREADPDQLSSLFKLDHLATRMRRNGENLLVLAGEEPGRRWTRPVPLVDVLRAAASEVEQYERIELSSVPATEVAGRVVNDLVHLLAELLENATSFSSPQTKVKVTGHALPDGRVLIEIHDTGIGLSPEDLAAINERLASPPTVDVSVSRRMGLFVVGRLSQRHGIRIQLRPSDSGGTTALVMLPVDVAQGGKKAPSSPGAGAGGGIAQAAAGAAAARQQTAGNQAANQSAGRLAAPPPRGQGAGSGPRAGLPRRAGGPAPHPAPGPAPPPPPARPGPGPGPAGGPARPRRRTGRTSAERPAGQPAAGQRLRRAPRWCSGRPRRQRSAAARRSPAAAPARSWRGPPPGRPSAAAHGRAACRAARWQPPGAYAQLGQGHSAGAAARTRGAGIHRALRAPRSGPRRPAAHARTGLHGPVRPSGLQRSASGRDTQPAQPRPPAAAAGAGQHRSVPASPGPGQHRSVPASRLHRPVRAAARSALGARAAAGAARWRGSAGHRRLRRTASSRAASAGPASGAAAAARTASGARTAAAAGRQRRLGTAAGERSG